ncbi:MAG: Tfx family DNA-binding protein [Candidatus Hadarchaeales archaeon]
MIDIERTHLTERQFEVLKLRMAGKSLAEIAEILGTTRSNVSRISRMAEQNIERAKNTLKLIQTMEWPIIVHARAGANVYQVSEKVFSRADEKGIKIAHNYAELVRLITETLGRRGIKRRRALRGFTVAVSGDGRVEVI